MKMKRLRLTGLLVPPRRSRGLWGTGTGSPHPAPGASCVSTRGSTPSCPADARIEKLADGFVFTEGPVWIQSESRLLFSDVRANAIYQWTEAEGAGPFIDPVFEGDVTGRRSISSNGLTLDAEGRLIICEHGNRLISRLEADGTRTTLVDRYEGKRLNSPNDAVYSTDGWLYFTDPPYGLEGLEESPMRELDLQRHIPAVSRRRARVAVSRIRPARTASPSRPMRRRSTWRTPTRTIRSGTPTTWATTACRTPRVYSTT